MRADELWLKPHLLRQTFGPCQRVDCFVLLSYDIEGKYGKRFQRKAPSFAIKGVSGVEAGANTIEVTNADPLGALTFPEGRTSVLGKTATACVVCCSTPSMSIEVIHRVSHALKSVASVRSVVLSDSGEKLNGVDTVAVPKGTKLSKIRHLVDLVDVDLICICDPDLSVDEASCRQVFERACAEIRIGNDVVAFGIVQGRDDGTMLSRVIALDKWLSHRVIRRFLWNCGVGITLPGQFLVVSARVLRRLDPDVDSYLDDLYLGWIARTHGIRVCRLPLVVGEEDPRVTWGSLLTQRVRWMRGLASLFGHLAFNINALLLLTIHYLAYHGLPILVLMLFVILSIVSPTVALAVFLGLAVLLARLSGQSLWTAATFVAVFPIVHCLVTLLWWIPASRSFLAMR